MKFRASETHIKDDPPKNYPHFNAYIVLESKKHIKCITVEELEGRKGISPSSRNYLGSRKEFDLDKEEHQDAQALKKIMEWLRDGGREPLTIMKRDVRENAPAIQAIDQDDFIVPANTTDLEEAVQMTHRIWFSGETQLLQAARDRRWNMTAVKALSIQFLSSNSYPIIVSRDG